MRVPDLSPATHRSPRAGTRSGIQVVGQSRHCGQHWGTSLISSKVQQRSRLMAKSSVPETNETHSRGSGSEQCRQSNHGCETQRGGARHAYRRQRKRRRLQLHPATSTPAITMECAYTEKEGHFRRLIIICRVVPCNSAVMPTFCWDHAMPSWMNVLFFCVREFIIVTLFVLIRYFLCKGILRLEKGC